jgi:hypothetical protein
LAANVEYSAAHRSKKEGGEKARLAYARYARALLREGLDDMSVRKYVRAVGFYPKRSWWFDVGRADDYFHEDESYLPKILTAMVEKKNSDALTALFPAWAAAINFGSTARNCKQWFDPIYEIVVDYLIDAPRFDVIRDDLFFVAERWARSIKGMASKNDAEFLVYKEFSCIPSKGVGALTAEERFALRKDLHALSQNPIDDLLNKSITLVLKYL